MQVRAADAMGFAISPPIRNRPVAAEVDRVRQREFLRWLLVGAVLVGAAVFDGWQRHGVLDHGFKLGEVQRERAAEIEKGRQLQLDIASLSAPGRLERLARTELHLVQPGPSDAIVLERIVPPEQPPSSVVASR